MACNIAIGTNNSTSHMIICINENRLSHVRKIIVIWLIGSAYLDDFFSVFVIVMTMSRYEIFGKFTGKFSRSVSQFRMSVTAKLENCRTGFYVVFRKTIRFVRRKFKAIKILRSSTTKNQFLGIFAKKKYYLFFFFWWWFVGCLGSTDLF